MSVIVRLQNLPWAANAVDIRQYFHGLSIPEGGVHIVGGELGDAFIAFSTDEDARQAMLRDGGKVKDISIKLYLSSRAEMQKIIDQARQQSLGMQQFMSIPAMPPMSVPVTNMAVPAMPVPGAPMANVQNVPAMQVPLQNVAAIVTNMAKRDSPGMGHAVPPVGGIPDHSDSKSITSISQSVKSDSEKDKKDKRRRRSRSRSRETSNSRSDSRSRSRSSSRSRDRKSRDRYYDRRRKRSRSRDRRRRRDKSKSRERSYRDRRKDYNRHSSREEFDDNSQSRYNNPVQSSRPSKLKPDFYSRESLYQSRDSTHQNRDSGYQNRGSHHPKASSAPKGAAANSDSTKSSFPNNVSNSVPNDNKSTLPSIPHKKDNSVSHTPAAVSDPALPTKPAISSVPAVSTTANSVTAPSTQSTQGFCNLPPPPMFMPQNLVSYPNFNPNIGPFNMFPPMHPHDMNTLGAPHDVVNVQESGNKSEFSGIPPMANTAGTDQKMPDLPTERGKPRFGNEVQSNDIALPSNDKIQNIGASTNWGYSGSNYAYGNNDVKSGYNEMKTDSNKGEPFNSSWNNLSESNTNSKNINSFNKKPLNTCVQIKYVPDFTKHDDIREFFRNNHINPGCLKIVTDDRGKISVVYVKFSSVGEKKKAICRSGCLLNNSIVNVLHVDDNEFENAVDMMEVNKPYWNSGHEAMRKDETEEMRNKEVDSDFTCIKLQGNVRIHPLYNAKNKVHPHIKSLCNSFSPVDVVIFNARGPNTIDAFIKFKNDSIAKAAFASLNNARVDGNPIACSMCSSEEFRQAKNNSIAMDVEHFLRTAKSQSDNVNKPHAKQDDRVDPRLQSSSYSDRMMKTEDGDEDDSYNDDMKMSDEEPETTVKRSNKVLLPTPSNLMPMQLPKDGPYGMHTNCILIQNLPLQANDRDILELFSDIGVVPTQIHIMLDANGKQYGDAFCEFETNDEAISAVSKNNFMIGKNNINIRLVSRQEMSNALGLSVLTSGPNIPGGPMQGGPFFNAPNIFGNNMRMDPPRMGNNDWMPPFNSGGGLLGPNPNFSSLGDRGYRSGGRGVSRGRSDGDFGGRGRGGRGVMSDRGGRGRNEMSRGRGNMDSGMRGSRGNDGSSRGLMNTRGMGSTRNSDRGGRGGRGSMKGDLSRGGRDMGDMPRNQPPDLMSLSTSISDQNDSGGNYSHSSQPVTRPIQLEEESVREFGQPGCVVSAENVPYRAELNDILDFFSDFDITAERIIRRYNDIGQVTGDARIAFKTPNDAKEAIKTLNRKMIGSRKVILTLFK